MCNSRSLWALALAVVCVDFAAQGDALAQTKYQLPPKTVVDILDAKPVPTVVLSPSRQQLALLDRASMPTVADLSQPMFRLAGARVNPKTNGPHRTQPLTGIALQRIADGKTVKVVVPAGARLGWLGFSPDGRRIAFTETKASGIALWVADATTGVGKLLTTPTLNATSGAACDWTANTALLCKFVVATRGASPKAPQVPEGPNVEENLGKTSPVSTYEDLLKTSHDDALFEYYFTSQLAFVNATTGVRTLVGKPGIYDQAEPSPNGEFLFVSRIKRPFSHLVPSSDFPKDVELWTKAGKVVRSVADVPSGEHVPMRGVETGPRAFKWNPVDPATLAWAEALDGGDLRNKVPYRDKVMLLKAPFAGEPSELIKLEQRFEGVAWTDKNVVLVTEFERNRRLRRTWVLDGGAARKIWEVSSEDRYKDPGHPVVRPRSSGGNGGRGRSGAEAGTIVQVVDSIYLNGDGASPRGDRPFLDRYNLKTGDTERIWQCEGESYEQVVNLLTDDGKTLLTRYETVKAPPNYFVRDLAKQGRRALTEFKDPAPQLAGVERQLLTYDRKDGVKLSATLYLPPGYKKGERLPLVMWAYPREFTDPSLASQVSGSPYRFTTYTGPSHMFFLTQGYAVLDNPTMPIVGAGETANDTYIDQLVASAEAAIDKVVDLGVADRDRIGVGGHSYGAFMTANLLSHSRLFRAGIARSGAYNRTLTPFGFQAERRTFWEVPEVYARMSPFYYANNVKDPILLTHGEADDNSGTFPIQSERFYMALKGHGATVRYVTLPNEAHGYTGRESVLHTLAEMIGWFDKYVKNAPPRGTTPTKGH
ncbi:MAG TPA: prolyl oligopeptidase family serine peptidase [Vicinamibacterales bacterium]|jgi:dipeptidyl aminopeptidase/acylaminoacyl peptidase